MRSRGSGRSARQRVGGRKATEAMRARARCSTLGSGTSPRTGSAAVSCSSSRSPRTSRSTTTRRSRISKWGWLFPARMIERARRLIEEFDVRGGGPRRTAGELSGGNQQKVVVAREVARDPKVLIAAQPTRGLDVGAIEYLHRRLVAERDGAGPCCSISLELDEVFSLSDRILVIYEGEIVGEHTGDVSEQRDRPRDARRPEARRPREHRRPEAARPEAPEEADRSRTLAAQHRAQQRAGGIAVAGGHGRARVPDRAASSCSRPATTHSSPTGTSSRAPA